MGLPEEPRRAGDVPPEWFEWRGGVNVKLETIDKKVDKNSETLEKMPDVIEKRMRKVVSGSTLSFQAKPPGNGQPITFKWFTEKLLLPIVLLIATIVIAAALAG